MEITRKIKTIKNQWLLASIFSLLIYPFIRFETTILGCEYNKDRMIVNGIEFFYLIWFAIAILLMWNSAYRKNKSLLLSCYLILSLPIFILIYVLLRDRMLFILDFLVVSCWYITSIRLWKVNTGELNIHPIFLFIALITIIAWIFSMFI